MTYEQPKNLTVDQLSKILKAIPELKAWIASVEEYALNAVQSGTEVPGFELGTTRSSRVWTDETKVIEVLEDKGIDPDKYLPRSLLSVAQMEKLLGKSEFNNLLAQEVGQTTGNPKLIQKS
jgi:hypothetical protein